MSQTQVATVSGAGVASGPRGAPGAPGDPGAPDGGPGRAPPARQTNGPDYSKKPNVRPQGDESVPDAEWARWRLYKQRPDIRDNFPAYFPDMRRQLHERCAAQNRAADDQATDPPRFKRRSLRELNGHYEPTQLGFASLTTFYDEADRLNAKLSRRERLDTDEEGDKIPSLWFERMAHDLFARVWEFSSDTFGLHSITESHNDMNWTRRWLHKLPREFVDIASQVARGDPTIAPPKESDPTNWEYLFLDQNSRVKLMVGIMAKLLEKNVFNSLLFGARDEEKTALESDDRATSFVDNSYQRNRNRSATVRTFVQSTRPPLGTGLPDLFTDNFWDEVATVTMGILDLLLPFINIIGNDMRHVPWPPLKQVHQRLHDIVAEAAWFTNGMRATKSVFWIDFPLPGEINDIKHEHAIDDIWNRSKARAIVSDSADLQRWQNERDAALAQQHPGVPITEAHRAAYAAQKPRPNVRRTAKVQVAMWPFIKRYSPVRERDAGDGAYNSGEIITEIMKSQTVYYYGDDSDEGDLKERRTLREHIGNRRWAEWFSWHSLLLLALFVLLVFFLTAPNLRRQVDYEPWSFKSTSRGYEFSGRGKSTTKTIVAVPIGTEIIAETIVGTESGPTIVVPADDVPGTGAKKDEPSKSKSESHVLSVSKVTETIKETIIQSSGVSSLEEAIDAKTASTEGAKDSSDPDTLKEAQAGYAQVVSDWIKSGTEIADASRSSSSEQSSIGSSPESEGDASDSQDSESGQSSVDPNLLSAFSPSKGEQRKRDESISSEKEASSSSAAEQSSRDSSSLSEKEASSSLSSASKQSSIRSSLKSKQSSIDSSFASGKDAVASSISSMQSSLDSSLASERDAAASSVASEKLKEGILDVLKDHVTSSISSAKDAIASGVGYKDEGLTASEVEITTQEVRKPVQASRKTTTITLPEDMDVVTVIAPAKQTQTNSVVYKVKEKGTKPVDI